MSRRSEWPRECPVFALRETVNDYWIEGDICQLEELDYVYPEWLLTLNASRGYSGYLDPATLRPLTWAAKEMLKAVRRG